MAGIIGDIAATQQQVTPMPKTKPQAVTFNAPTKHGTLLFPPNTPLAFADKDAAPYFVAAGLAKNTATQPVMTYPKGQVDIDPETTFGNGDKIGRKVLNNG